MAAADTRGAGPVYFNASFSLSPADLLWAVPRLVHRATTFTFNYLPEQLDDFFALARSPGRILPDATSKSTTSNASITTTRNLTQSAASASSTAAPFIEEGFISTIRQLFSSQRLSNLDGVFSYLASRWAISTFIIAIILNRAHVYASSRRRIHLNWQTRLTLRIVPILLFLHQLETVLQAMRCQTGTYLSESPSNDTEIRLNRAFTNEGGVLHRLSSALLFWQTEQDSCQMVGMVPLSSQLPAVGSSSVLWPLFLSLCLSHFVETISCALQGRRPMAETGMTIFEHSLAFAEAEAVVRSSAGLGLFGMPKPSQKVEDPTSQVVTLTRSMILHRLNVPPEVLLIALISSCSHVTSHVLAVFGLQSRFRLVNTTVWGTCFMSAFLWSFVKFSRSASDTEIGVLRYPTVCIIGFIPHLLIVAGIIVCGFIYGLALLLTVLSPPTSQHSQGSWKERIKMAHSNLQASTALSNIHIRWKDEFYTTLLKVGFTVLTAASEAVYFNEGTHVSVSARTWLEEKRYRETASKYIHKNKPKSSPYVPPEIQGDFHIAEGLIMMEEANGVPSPHIKHVSGFAKERKTGNASSRSGAAATKEEGVGGSQRSGRWYLSMMLAREIFTLIAGCFAKGLMICLRKLGVRLPQWLSSVARLPERTQEHQRPSRNRQRTLNFWMLADDGSLYQPTTTNLDVEAETRKRMRRSDSLRERTEEQMDHDFYEWWKSGGFWGDLDSSGDYVPSTREEDDDATSAISVSTDDGSVYESVSDSEDGRRTPTQDHPRLHQEAMPADEDVLHQLSRLLNPKTLEERHEARLLSQRLQRPGPLTRSQYQRSQDLDRLRLLGGATASPDADADRPMSSEEEEDLLEQIILSRRSTSTPHSQMAWTEGAEGMGADGPQCVVCRSCPRTILVWPCRCLSLCEECRVSLAMNNFASCVCCRRDVVAFSRLYVP